MQTGAGTIIAQNDEDVWTLQRWLLPGDDPEAMKAEEVLEAWAGVKFPYEILQANPWTANFVVAQRYHEGRVILAGDSAHQFIPTGGYGMNSGIADALAASWIVAARIQGWGGEGLLAAYEAERKPTAWWHLAASERHMGVRVQIGGAYAEAGAALEDQAPEGEAAREKLGRRIAELGNAENESWGVELGYRYDESPIIRHEPGAPEPDPLTYRPNTWPGARLPHVFLEPGVSIHDKLGRGFALVALKAADFEAAKQAAAARGIPFEVVSLEGRNLRGIYERDFILVRPDQHVVWRGDAPPEDWGALLDFALGKEGARA